MINLKIKINKMIQNTFSTYHVIIKLVSDSAVKIMSVRFQSLNTNDGKKVEIELPLTKHFPLIFNLPFNYIPNNNHYLRPLNPPITSLSCIYSFYLVLSNIECCQCF